MAHTWKYAIGLGFVGAALVTGCVVKTGDDDAVGSGGTTGGSGGSGATSGKGGSATGGSSGKGGSGGTGGSSGASGGTGGSSGGTTGGSSGTGGESGADTGGTAGTGGGGGTAGLPTEDQTTPECDPASGDLETTLYPNCEPTNLDDPDPCESCIQDHCCEESMACYGFDPGNVCGWGGPETGQYAGFGEIGCYVQCLSEYVTANELCDSDGLNECESACATDMCGGLLGNQTSDLASCLHVNCSSECFGIETCG